jgi:membrane protease subunit (stomatin/prohibitin family)
MTTLQRPTEASTALFWHAPPGRTPIGSALVVGEKECVVASLNGAILGVIAPGAHTLDPTSFPFLAPSIDAASNVGAELWFVRTSELQGIPIGGPVGTVRSELENLEVRPRLAGEYSVKVTDPARFVQRIMGVAGTDAVFATVSGILLRKAKELYCRVVTELRSVLMHDVVRRLTEELPATLDELQSFGLSAKLANSTISFSEEDQKALKAANAERALAARREKIKEIEAAASPGGKAKGPLFAILGVVGLVVAGVVVLVLHFARSESHAASAPAPGAQQHDARHKH